MGRLLLVAALMFAGAAGLGAQSRSFQVEEARIAQVHAAMTAKRLTCRALDDVDGLDEIRRPEGLPPCGGFKYDINRWLAGHGTKVPVHTLDEVIKSRTFHPSVQLRLERAQEGPEHGPETHNCKADVECRDRVRAAVLKTMDTLNLDAFVYPTWSNPPRLIGDLNTPHGDNSQFFSPTTGWPALQCRWGTRGAHNCPLASRFGRACEHAGHSVLIFDF